MDRASATAPAIEQDEWDADGFEIPSLNVGKPGVGRKEPNRVKTSLKGTTQKVTTGIENIYLGPHGAPPSQMKQQEVKASAKKHPLKKKLKEVDRKATVVGREDKVDALGDLIGSKIVTSTITKGAQTEWLDPHCHESRFKRAV